MPELYREQFIPADPTAVWDFFATPLNLNELTPPAVRFRILGPAPARMHAGQLITYRISPVRGIWLRWLTEITVLRAGECFVDEQRAGPYRRWSHEHRFTPVPGGVMMTDRVTYEVGWGPLGWLAHRLWVRRKLESIFAYRRRRVTEIFGRA